LVSVFEQADDKLCKLDLVLLIEIIILL
jgi:hypothetical protein